MDVITYFEQRSNSSRIAWLRAFSQLQGQTSDFFCYGWIFSPNSGLLTLTANQCCSQSMLLPALLSLFLSAITYLSTTTSPVYFHLLPKLTPPSHSTAEHQWGSSDTAQWGAPFPASSFSSFSLLEGKAIYFYGQLTYIYFIVHSDYSVISSHCVWFISHITSCFILTAYLPWT